MAHAFPPKPGDRTPFSSLNRSQGGSPVSRTSVTAGTLQDQLRANQESRQTVGQRTAHAESAMQSTASRSSASRFGSTHGTRITPGATVNRSAPSAVLTNQDSSPLEVTNPTDIGAFASTASAKIPSSLRGGVSLKGYADLCRLARFGANLSDAHSCFIFLHANILAALDPGLLGPEGLPDSMILAGHHSLSAEVIPQCEVARSSGLIGWVAKHSRSIHVSPFELDSRTLGIYASDQQLKSFIGIPIRLEDSQGLLSSVGAHPEHLTGVLACDSKKSFAFSKLQGKLLEDLSAEIANTVSLLIEQQGKAHPDVAWHSFLRRSSELMRSVGAGSTEILRIVVTNFNTLEQSIGTSSALTACEQIYRLIQQVLPPHFPSVRLANGDILIALDNMMTSFYESRIRAVSAHAMGSGNDAQSGARPHLQYEFVKTDLSRLGDRRRKGLTVEQLVQSTSVEPSELRNAGRSGSASNTVVRLDKEVTYGYRRA